MSAKSGHCAFERTSMNQAYSREPSVLIGVRTEAMLRGIVRSAMRGAPEVAMRLLGEVDRADIVMEDAVPVEVVTLGSLVTYQTLATGSINTIQLVPPHEADLKLLRVSVVSDIGAALIGLRTSQRIEWEFGGRRHVLEVLRVSKEP